MPDLTHADVKLAHAERVLRIRERQLARASELADSRAESREGVEGATLAYLDALRDRDLALLDAGRQPEPWA